MEAQQKTPQEILEPQWLVSKSLRVFRVFSTELFLPFLMADNTEFLNFFHNRSKASPPHS